MRLGILPKALKRRKPMTSELSQHDKDFAHAMALKLRLNRERKAAEKKNRIELNVIVKSFQENASTNSEFCF